MTEFRRDKILPEDLIQRTNLSQHNLMIDAINDIDGRQGDIERITNVNIDDITDLKTDVIVLSDNKLDKGDINADLHFGDITVTRDGTVVIMSLDVLNPTTGITTPISFTIPGATSALAGAMDASSVAWIADAENRISALEGLSDVKAIVGLSAIPTQAEINTAWMDTVGKVAETGDLVQDVSNAKLWVYVTDTWILYGTLVVVPLATTTSLGGIKDTALDALGNRWYCHVEADGRLALIGGDTLSTLVDTTVPAIQSGVSNAVNKSGDTMTGRLYANGGISIEREAETSIIYKRTDTGYKSPWARYKWELVRDKDAKNVGESVITCTNADPTYGVVTSNFLSAMSYRSDGTQVKADLVIRAQDNGDCSVQLPMRASPAAGDAVNKGYLDTRLAAKQDVLTIDSAPASGSTNPITSGGVYTALVGKQDAFGLYEHTIRVWTTVATDKFRFSLTVLNQSSTPFTLPALYSYFGSGSNDYKQCSGMVLTTSGLIILTGVRGGNPTEIICDGIVASTGDIITLSLNWVLVEVLITDKVRQIV